MISSNVDQIFVIYFKFGDNAARETKFQLTPHDLT